MNKNIVYMVTELDSGETTVFDSMKNLLDKFKCVTEARVMACIESGDKYKGLVFDVQEVECHGLCPENDGFDFEGVVHEK